MPRTMDHDPNARLDYRWDWAGPDWPEGDTILAATVTATGVTVEPNPLWSGTSVVAWVSGGTIGQEVPVTCHITTAGGRTDDRTIWLRVRDR